MGADQQFCLRWNNFHTNITSAFESLRDDEDFVDITLACEGRQVKAHKMVLSACSPYFRSLLKGNPCQHPIVFLKDVTFANLASILDFMYHGEVNVSHNELATFLKTAEALKVRGLAEDDKRKDSDGYADASSPGPPRDPPDPGSPRPDETSATDTHLSDSPPPHKKRRRSGASIQSAEDTNETVISDIRETSVKNEPQEFNDEDDMLGHSVDTGDLKADNISANSASGGNDENEERSNFGISESVTISRSQAAMQQLQESFGSFLPAMSQSSGFLSHGATDMPRPPFPLEGVQGLPPGISALPGPSMSQAGASQDTSQGEGDKEPLDCSFCGKNCSSRYNLKKHVRDIHLNKGNKFTCQQCNRTYSSLNSLQVHRSVTHPTGNRRRHTQSTGRRRSSGSKSYDEITLDQDMSQDSRDEQEFEDEQQTLQGIHSVESRAKRDLLPVKNVDPLMNVESVSHQTHLMRTPHSQEAHLSRDRISNQSHNLSPQVHHSSISPQLHSSISPQMNTSLSPQLHNPISPHHQPQPAHTSTQQSLFHHTHSQAAHIHSPVSSQRPLSLTSHSNKPSKSYEGHSHSYSHHMNNPLHNTFHQSSGAQHTSSQYRMHSPHSYSPVVSPYDSGERSYPQTDSEEIPSSLMHSLNAFKKVL